MAHIKLNLGRLKQILSRERRDPAINLTCSEFEVDNWLISDFIVHKLAPIVGTHPSPIAELNLMVAAICRLKPQQIFEWGTNIGKSARIFYEIGKYFDISLQIHSVDLPDDIEHGEHPRSDRGFMVRNCHNVKLYQGDGLKKSIELFQATSNQDTLVFIDGDHSYQSVLRELNGVVQNMPNANVLLHDTFYQSEASNYNTGPFRAIQEVLASNPNMYKALSTNTGLPGMTLLYRR